MYIYLDRRNEDLTVQIEFLISHQEISSDTIPYI